MTDQAFAASSEDRPAACPFCGRSRIRGILPSPDGNRWYRCVACATSFFLTSQVADHEALTPVDRPANGQTQ